MTRFFLSLTLLLATMLADGAMASPKWAPAGYIELRGAEAKQFLIGNTLAVVKINAHFKMGPLYFADDGKIFDRTYDYCRIEPHRLSETENCELEPPSLPRCEGYRVFRKAGIDPSRAAAGARVGLYVGAGALGRERLVLKGNDTGCPAPFPDANAKPVELSAQQAERVDRDAPSQYLDLKTPEAFPEDPRGRYLVGNSVVKPADDPGCGDSVTYFAPDGRVIQYHCTRNPPLQSGEKAPTHASIDLLRSWKIATAYFCFPGDPKKADCVMKPVAKRFCLNNLEEKGQFDDCRSLDLETVAVGVGSEWRFQIRVKDGLAGFPGLLVAGDPLGLGRLAPRPRD